MSNTARVLAMTDRLEDAEFDQPVTKWHEVKNALQANTTTIAVIAERQKTDTERGARIESLITAIHTRLDGINERAHRLEVDLAKLEEKFGPVRNVVYGLVALLLVAIISAMVALVLSKP